MNATAWIALATLLFAGVCALIGHAMWDARMFAKHGERLATLEAHAAKCKCSKP